MFKELVSIVLLSLWIRGSQRSLLHFDDPIIEYFLEEIMEVQTPSKENIMHLLSKDELSFNRIVKEVPVLYIVSVHSKLKSNGYNFSSKQSSKIAFYMWKNENKND